MILDEAIRLLESMFGGLMGDATDELAALAVELLEILERKREQPPRLIAATASRSHSTPKAAKMRFHVAVTGE